ncbi:Wzy polymerase domain-containing protein [Propionivibrio sp.]|uniref:PglL family O-oligosaccharyltransferase n=1 Tax=Propionivibrio sp. TaxID=2212460 RepID=UPI003BEF5627
MLPLRWHLRFSLAALCLMLIVPFLNPHHYNPIPTFYQEWSAVAFSLLALTLLLRREILNQLEVPAIALLPLGIGALLLAQFATGSVEFLSQALIFLLYLLWAMFMLIIGGALRQRLGLDGLVTPLAFALLSGGLLAAGLLGLQLSSSPLGLGFVFQRAGGGGIGNLAQPNHLANYLWLGLASAIYLYGQGRLGKLTFALSALLLLSCASLTGSRSVLLYATGFALLSGWAAWHYKLPALYKIARVALLLLPLTFLIQFTFSYFDLANLLGTSVSGERFFREVSGPSMRLQLWRTGLAIFADHPWLGAGIGQFPWNFYILVGAQADGTYIGGGEHAHNLFIQLLAEFGIIAPLLVLLLGWRWWLGFVGQNWTPAHWWIAAVLLVEAVHSQLEYPLWYTFFLGIAALAFGAGSTGSRATIRPKISRLGRLIVALMLLLGGVTLFTLGNDYRTLERTLNTRWQGGQRDQETWDKHLATLARLHRESLLSHYVELVYAYSLAVDRDALKEKIIVSQHAISFSPVAKITFNLACLLALDGQAEEAQLALRRALGTHPDQRAKALRQIKDLLTTYPELSPLLEQLETVDEPGKSS